MGFITNARFEFSSKDETKPVQEEFKKNRKRFVIEFDSTSFVITLVQRDSLMEREVEVHLLQVVWEFDYNNQTNSYTATCSTEDVERTVELNPDIGEYIYELVEGIARGDVTGSIACGLVRVIFRELEIKHAPQDSWVKEHFPKFFKQEQVTIERQKRKIVKDVMKT